uniref:Potassium voltage-gated channel, subfamily G, member 2 n=1 Tax=Xiphophorus couchianus TaxID=32473 RepID=A0A3B5L9P2_9TELE
MNIQEGCTVGSTVALQQEGGGFDSRPGDFLHGVCMFSLCMRGFSPASSYITSKKGLFYKRAQVLLQPQPNQQDRDEAGVADRAAIINVGGIKYHIPWSTLDEFPLTRLGKLRSCSNEAEIMDVCDDYDVSRNEYFFDRNPSAFRIIVTFLAAGKLRLLREMCALSFQEELLYWGLEDDNLEWCCLRKLRLRQEEYKELQRLEEEEAELTSPQSCEESQQPPGGKTSKYNYFYEALYATEVFLRRFKLLVRFLCIQLFKITFFFPQPLAFQHNLRFLK